MQPNADLWAAVKQEAKIWGNRFKVLDVQSHRLTETSDYIESNGAG